MLGAREGGARRVVEVDDPLLAVGEHHGGGNLVERLANAGVLGGHQPLVLDLGAQLVLHVIERAQHAAGLVRAA